MKRLAIKKPDEVRKRILAYLASDDEQIQYFLRLNAMLLLMQPGGPGAIEIAEMYGLARQTVTRWAARLNSSGGDITVLLDSPKPGRDTRMSNKQIALIDKTLLKSPRKAGIQKDKWTGVVLSDYLKQQYGIDLKVRMCQRWIRRMADAHSNPAEL